MRKTKTQKQKSKKKEKNRKLIVVSELKNNQRR